MTTTKTCTKCGAEKELSEFSMSRGKPRSNCRTCQAAYYKEWKERDLEGYALRKRASNLRVKFGISLEQYEAAREAQNGGCAICGYYHEGRALAVDHDHETGALRGLLCDWCNTALGKFTDNVGTLQRAIRYLQDPPGIPGK